MITFDDRQFVENLLDQYAVDAWRRSVSCEHPERGVPSAMQVGEIDEDGWVEWRILPSTLGEAEVDTLELDFGVKFPPLFRAYLLARFHLFDQVRSRKHDQLVWMSDTPHGRPLMPLRGMISSWSPLIDAGFVPFAQWGDGWGPMCFDTRLSRMDGECPIVWMDHESLAILGPDKCRNRDAVLPLAKVLYPSCREFLTDVFGRPA